MSRPVVIFVCSGNTCRSPLAEAVAHERFPWLSCASAGLGASTGSPASAGTCDMARDRGLDVDGHRSRRLEPVSADAATWLIGMTGEHVRGIHAALPGYTGRVAKLGRPGVALGPDADVGPGEDVDDPWRKGTELAYELMAEQVDRLLAAWDDVFAEEAR